MKRVYVDEKWCLGCHLCEYNCAFANSGKDDMVLALKDQEISSNITVEEGEKVNFAVSCRHCEEPLCVKSCITGALHVENGVIKTDDKKCVSCYTCILVCPYGCIVPSIKDKKVIQKCELCLENNSEPACVKGCPNKAIIFEEREEE